MRAPAIADCGNRKSNPKTPLVGQEAFSNSTQDSKIPASAVETGLALLVRTVYGMSSEVFPHLTVAEQEKVMAFLSWTVLGVAAGIVGSRLGTRRREGLLPDVPLGLAGAVAGGWLYYTFGPSVVNGFHLFSLLAATAGSMAVLLVYYAITHY